MKYIILLFLLSSNVTATKNKLRVIGGTVDTEIKFPWVVRLEIEANNKLYSICTGSLLHPEIVLTAAHCAGDYISIQSNDTQKQYSKILERVNHKDSSMPNNDIALYKVAQTVLDSYGMVSAADYTSLIGLEVYIMGFGRTQLNDKNGQASFTSSHSLKYGSGVVDKCKERLSLEGISAMCIYRRCKDMALLSSGDSGGPLLLDGKIFAVNTAMIRSDFQDPRLQSLAVIATPVSPYLNWLQRNIAIMLSTSTNS